MQELEHIIDALENPPQKPAAVPFFGSLAAAGYAIYSVLNAASVKGVFSLSGSDMIGLAFGGAAIVAQVAAFVASFRKDAHYKRALRYAREMLADCQEQEAGDDVPPRRAAPALPSADTAVAEDESQETMVQQAEGRRGGQ